MAQINVIGFVTDNIIPKHRLNESAYVYFYVKEYISKSRYTVYQIYASGETVDRLKRLRIKKGSHIWLTGSIELVDHTASKEQNHSKMLRVYCSDLGIVSYPNAVPKTAESRKAESPSPGLPVELDGDRNQLPE